MIKLSKKKKQTYKRPEAHIIPNDPPQGFRKIKIRSHGQAIYTNGKYYITPDVDQHNGGWWKKAKKPEWLFSKNKRKGTYEKYAKMPIGD